MDTPHDFQIGDRVRIDRPDAADEPVFTISDIIDDDLMLSYGGVDVRRVARHDVFPAESTDGDPGCGGSLYPTGGIENRHVDANGAVWGYQPARCNEDPPCGFVGPVPWPWFDDLDPNAYVEPDPNFLRDDDHENWALTPEGFFKTNVVIGGISFHLVAFPVTDASGVQRGRNEFSDAMLEALEEVAPGDGPFQTLDILTVPCVVFATPHRS
jgi:hypothetical protein